MSAISGILCCNYCFALPLLEDPHMPKTSTPRFPQLTNRSQMGLAWPSVVGYSGEDIASHDEISHHPSEPTSHGERLVETNGGNEGSWPKPEASQWILPGIIPYSHIRLLRLKPALTESPIHADIEIVDLQSPSLPMYEALSYTWADESGDFSRCYPVFLGEYWDIIYVTRNCEEALRAVRREQVDRLLWVDSLCISQEISDEKSQQVGLIREIYSKAVRVVAYLGGESSDSNMALQFLQELAAAGPKTPNPSIAINSELQRSLRCLFHQPYFSRLWIVQEVSLARSLEIVSGRYSVPWPRQPSVLAHPNIDVPSWLFRDQLWYGFTGQDLLRILQSTSPYKCSDPRDKIFAVLGLIYKHDIVPDYRLPIESIYTGIAAYLIKCCHTMDVLALAGINRKTFNIPSWVPDWSQQLAPFFPNNLFDSEGKFRIRDSILVASTRIVFHNIIDPDHEIQISADTGSMRIHSVKLCNIDGLIGQSKDGTYITMPIGQRGTLIVTLSDRTYQIGADAVFLLSGWDHPVILRHDPDSDSYSLVSACVLSFGSPLPRIWYRPWNQDEVYSRQGGIKVSALSLEENNLLLDFHSRLAELCRTPISSTPRDTTISFSTIRDRMFSFFLLSLTKLRDIETRLRTTWYQLNHKLGWMFRDQAAAWKLLQEINQGNFGQQLGEAEIKLHEFESIFFIKYCGVEFPTSCHWDLGRFCWSFLQPAVLGFITATEETWSPVFDQLKSQLPEIRTWAETTEQLFQVFEYSDRILDCSWVLFPNTQLRPAWLTHYENFRHAIRQSLSLQQQEEGEPPHRAHLDSSCFWNWVEFEGHLRAREQLWAQELPRELDPSINSNIAALVVLKSLGLDFYSDRVIEIR